MSVVYPWQQRAWEYIDRIKQQQRLPHAMILSGKEGTGLRHFADVLANHLLCQSGQDICGTCRDCHLFASGNHPDLFSVQAEDNARQIKVDQIRELIDFISLKSFAGGVKMAIIDPADIINTNAANTLLKTLEEPPENSLLLLISHRPSVLPVTLRSRCQLLTVQAHINEQTVRWVHDQFEGGGGKPDILLELAEGAPLLAVSMHNGSILADREKILNQLFALLENKADPIKVADEWNIVGCREAIEWILKINHAMIVYKLCASIRNSALRTVKMRLHYHAKRLHLLQLSNSYNFILGRYRLALSSVNLGTLGLLEEITIYWQSKLAEN